MLRFMFVYACEFYILVHLSPPLHSVCCMLLCNSTQPSLSTQKNVVIFDLSCTPPSRVVAPCVVSCFGYCFVCCVSLFQICVRGHTALVSCLAQSSLLPPYPTPLVHFTSAQSFSQKLTAFGCLYYMLIMFAAHST